MIHAKVALGLALRVRAHEPRQPERAGFDRRRDAGRQLILHLLRRRLPQHVRRGVLAQDVLEDGDQNLGLVDRVALALDPDGGREGVEARCQFLRVRCGDCREGALDLDARERRQRISGAATTVQRVRIEKKPPLYVYMNVDACLHLPPGWGKGMG
ncbi:hypothetical protein VTO42DRAFT_4902 [Malbranchea cinnamomea]